MKKIISFLVVFVLMCTVFGLLGAGLPATNFNSTSQVNPGQDTLDESKTLQAFTNLDNSKETETRSG